MADALISRAREGLLPIYRAAQGFRS